MREPEENSKELSEKGSKLTEESTQAEESTQVTGKQPLSETWSQDAQDELQEFIELQGIYIRQ